MHKKGSHPLPLRTPLTQFVHIQLGSSRWQQIGKRRPQLVGHLFLQNIYMLQMYGEMVLASTRYDHF